MTMRVSSWRSVPSCKVCKSPVSSKYLKSVSQLPDFGVCWQTSLIDSSIFQCSTATHYLEPCRIIKEAEQTLQTAGVGRTGLLVEVLAIAGEMHGVGSNGLHSSMVDTLTVTDTKAVVLVLLVVNNPMVAMAIKISTSDSKSTTDHIICSSITDSLHL